MSDDDASIATPSQTVGPFFHFALTVNPIGQIAGRFQGGEPVRLIVRVLDGDGRPVTDAMVELWQAGVFGRMPTGEEGACTFETVRPGTAAGERPGRQAPHINVQIFARGLLRPLQTRIYFQGDAAVDDDPTLRLIPEARRATLLARPNPDASGEWAFDVRLQGAGETVFFNA